MAHLHNEPVDSIIFSEVMFDKTHNISGENPEHIWFVKNIAIPVFQSWGYQVHILRAEKDFLSVFHHTIKHARKYKEHEGMTYGFPISKLCAIKRDCKLKPIDDFRKSIADEMINYVGIGIDEPKRLKSLHKTRDISLLEKYGYTTKMARDLCIQYGLYSPVYKLSHRGGCWFCPNAKIAEHRSIRKCEREAWNLYVSLEKKEVAYKKWNVYSTLTLQDIDQILQSEDIEEKK